MKRPLVPTQDSLIWTHPALVLVRKYRKLAEAMAPDILQQHQAEKNMCVLPCKAPGPSQDYFNFACEDGSGERQANLWQSWKARISGVLVMHHNCKIMLPVFHVHSKSSFSLHPRGDGIIRNFLKLPLLFFFPLSLPWQQKKITPLKVVWTFASKYLSVWIGPKTNGITKRVTLLCNRWLNYLCR